MGTPFREVKLGTPSNGLGVQNVRMVNSAVQGRKRLHVLVTA